MAVLTAFATDPGMICSSTDAFPFSGMAVMYGLMGVFHLAPWLKLIAGRRSGAAHRT
jgi:hypothetical protein